MDLAGVKFLFDNQLIAGLEKLIRDSNRGLFLVSPFIDLDNRIKDALQEKISKYDYKLYVLFGKNEQNYLRSITPQSLKFLKQFPNIEIKYNERLHAKFYQNDHSFLLTSLNLYDFSLANNIEVGLLTDYTSKGVLGRLIDTIDGAVIQGAENVKKNLFGITKDEVDPIEKFQSIYDNSKLLYKSEPRLIDKKGIKGMLGGMQLDGIDVDEDLFSESSETPMKKQSLGFKQGTVKKLSVSQLAKSYNVSVDELNQLMEQKGLVHNKHITKLGASSGLIIRNYMGKDYIAYPDNLEEFKELS